MLNKIPGDWVKIEKEYYPMNGVYTNPQIKTLDAYKTPAGNIVIINLYKDNDFIDLYDGQMNEIASALRGKNWKEISTVNPLKFGYAEHNGVELYFSCYEISSSAEVAALQIFSKTEGVVGFLTAIKKPQNFDFAHLYDNYDVVKQIFNCIK